MGTELDDDKDLIPVETALKNLPSAELSLPVKKKPRKKGKIFVDKVTMLRMIEEIGDRENDRIQIKTAKDVEKLKISALREAAAARKRESKQERLRRIKESLRQKKAAEEEPSRDDKREDKSVPSGDNRKGFKSSKISKKKVSFRD
jgi:hypothetical protein